ncbi:MAG: hypothetical protein HDQ88_09850 [Clostridia bacterium]|nr:hypothetical protein [Clostridia bacterium]
MASIRKTKKRLKRQIEQLQIDRFVKPLMVEGLWNQIGLMDAIGYQIDLLKEELQNLKKRKK